jgi:hypothetical protein
MLYKIGSIYKDLYGSIIRITRRIEYNNLGTPYIRYHFKFVHRATPTTYITHTFVEDSYYSKHLKRVPLLQEKLYEI